jgi:hypothetical protein
MIFDLQYNTSSPGYGDSKESLYTFKSEGNEVTKRTLPSSGGFGNPKRFLIKTLPFG